MTYIDDELRETMAMADEVAGQLKAEGRKKCVAEKDYKVLLRQECLKMKAEGMTTGMIDKVCYGIDNVAEARLASQIAETDYTADLELLQWLKLKARLLDNQVSREWRSPEGL